MKKVSIILSLAVFLLSLNTAVKAEVTTNKQEKTLSDKINDKFEPFVKGMAKILFWDPFSASGIYDPVVITKMVARILVLNGPGRFSRKNGHPYRNLDESRTIWKKDGKPSFTTHRIMEPFLPNSPKLKYRPGPNWGKKPGLKIVWTRNFQKTPLREGILGQFFRGKGV